MKILVWKGDPNVWPIPKGFCVGLKACSILAQSLQSLVSAPDKNGCKETVAGVNTGNCPEIWAIGKRTNIRPDEIATNTQIFEFLANVHQSEIAAVHQGLLDYIRVFFPL